MELPVHGGLSQEDFDEVVDALHTWANTHPRKEEPVVMLMGRTLTPAQVVNEVTQETEFGASFLEYIHRQSLIGPTRPRTFIDRAILANRRT